MTWTEDGIAAALRDFAEREGRAPRWSDLGAAKGLPGPMAVCRHCGSFGNACVAAGFEALAPGGWSFAKWDETAAVDARVRSGETLARVAAELGVSGQALGRRLARYRRTMGPSPLRLSTGRRSVAS